MRTSDVYLASGNGKKQDSSPFEAGPSVVSD